jgi:hypothetical protein
VTVEGAGRTPSFVTTSHPAGQTVQSVDAKVQSVDDTNVQSVDPDANVQSVDLAKVQSVEVKVQSVDSARFIMTVSLWECGVCNEGWEKRGLLRVRSPTWSHDFA